MVSRVIPVEPFDLVVFGATGDLARRKILPGLYRRCLAGQVPDGSRIIGAARSGMTPDEFRAFAAAAIAEFVSPDKRDATAEGCFFDRLDYVAVDARGTDGWAALAGRMRPGVVRAFYFSVAPALFGAVRAEAPGVLLPPTGGGAPEPPGGGSCVPVPDGRPCGAAASRCW